MEKGDGKTKIAKNRTKQNNKLRKNSFMLAQGDFQRRFLMCKTMTVQIRRWSDIYIRWDAANIELM